MSDLSDNSKRLQKEKRRSRVRSLRSALIGLLFFWVFASLIGMFVLGVMVFSMKRDIRNLMETKTSVSGNIAINNAAKDSENLITMDSSFEPDKDDNLAGLSDTLKVYLTFDDGPSKNTEDILKVLDDYGVKATFFVQGKHDDKSKALLKQISDEGHTLGMHTYSHSYSKIYASLDSFKDDVNAISDLIYDATGKRSKFYRFPGGSSNGISGGKMGDFIKYINDEGLVYVDWNVASEDAKTPPLSEETIVENVMKDVVRYKTSIVLLHDSEGKETTVSALPILIERLRSEGAVLLPITEDTALIQHVTINE